MMLLATRKPASLPALSGGALSLASTRRAWGEEAFASSHHQLIHVLCALNFGAGTLYAGISDFHSDPPAFSH